MPAGRAVLHGWLSAWQQLRPLEPTAITGVHIAFGEPAAGIDGFRRTHDQSRHARRVAQLGHATPACTVYRDIAVSALLSADLTHARDFMTHTLGSVLEGHDADRLLETASVYQEEGLSLQRAAERLHVHRNTVAYRVRKVLESSGETCRVVETAGCGGTCLPDDVAAVIDSPAAARCVRSRPERQRTWVIVYSSNMTRNPPYTTITERLD